MPRILTYLAIGALSTCAVATPVAEPAITAAPSLEKRASCTFSGSTGAASASASQKSCATIVLSNVAVPSGVTLDLSNLNDGTHVRLRVCFSFCINTDSLFSVLGRLRGYNHLGL